MKEIWKPIKDFEGSYEISNLGRVKSLSRPRSLNQQHIITKEIILKHGINNNGYYYVNLCKNKKSCLKTIHRLVGLAFIPNPLNKPKINHKDTIKTNNYKNNLEWCTQKENIKHAIENDLMNWPKGEKHWDNKLTENQVLKIREKYIPYKYSTYKLAQEYGVSRTAIYSIIKNINWKHI